MTQLLDSHIMEQRTYLFTPYSATFLALSILAKEKEQSFQSIVEIIHDVCSLEEDLDKRSKLETILIESKSIGKAFDRLCDNQVGP